MMQFHISGFVVKEAMFGARPNRRLCGKAMLSLHQLQLDPRLHAGLGDPEGSELGDGFLADICKQWEAATDVAEAAGARVAHHRTGIVLSADGGALKKQLPIFKLGLGGKMGSGDQWLSWISIDDEVEAIVHLLTADIEGPVNLTAPQPVTNATFTKALGAALSRPTFVPIPKFGPRAILGREAAENLLFTGQRVLPAVLEGADGFEFQHGDLATALSALLDR